MLWLFFKFGALMISKITDINEDYSEIKKSEKRLLTKEEVFMRRAKSIIYLLIGLFFIYICWLIIKELVQWIVFNFVEVQPLVPEVE